MYSLALCSPQYIKGLCKKYQLSPSRHYGQHFLVSTKPIEAMIKAAEFKADDTVIEIGPGFGVLTLAVAPKVKQVVAFEIEKRLLPYWEEVLTNYEPVRRKVAWRPQKRDVVPSGTIRPRRFTRTDELRTNIEIIWGNALAQIKNLFGNYKVVANLPYRITSDVLRLFLEAEVKPEKIVMMVQKEVAERICAGPPRMSLLSVAVQYYGEPKIVMIVPRVMFWPEPRVDSAIVAIDIKTIKHENIKTFDRKFFRIVKAGFSHKRKQLWRNLSAQLKIPTEVVKQVLREVVGSDRVRAEELRVEEWRRLTERLGLTS